MSNIFIASATFELKTQMDGALVRIDLNRSLVRTVQ